MACSKHNGLCRTHLFQLRSLLPNSTGLPAVQVDFCPPDSSSSNDGRDILPTFNLDGKYYTAGFLLPCDQHYIQQNDIFEKDRFDRGVASKLLSSTDLVNWKDMQLVPQPSNNNRHCHCCRIHYDDYLEHIRSEEHRLRVSESLGNQYIQDLARQYAELRPAPIKRQAAPETKIRCSRRLQQTYEKKKDKEGPIGEVSTMTSQKNTKFEQGSSVNKGRLRLIGKRRKQSQRRQRAD